MKKNFLLATLLAALIVFTGCGESPSPEMSAEENTQTEEVQKTEQVDEKIAETKSAEEAKAEEMANEELYKPEMVEGEDGNTYNKMVVPVNGENVTIELPVIYFDFDKFNIRADMEAKVAKLAEAIKDNGLEGKTFHVGGHCDEWGADEYNIALGLKRAKTVERALQAYDVDTKFTLTSFGESKPVCFEHNKACWQKNRRAEIKILP